MLNEYESEWLLDALCVRLGFCLDPMVRDDLKSNPPADPESFASVIFQAEGNSADAVEPGKYDQVVQLIASAYDRAAEMREAVD